MSDTKSNGAILKLFNVMYDLGWVEKNAEVSMGSSGFAYANEAAMLAALIPLFKKHRLLIVPHQVKNVDIIEKRTINNTRETVNYLTTITMVYRFYDADTGDYIESEVVAQGIDLAGTDKGVYKALTGALKYVLRQATLMGTGDDPESETLDNNGNLAVVKNPQVMHVMSGVREIFKLNNVSFNEFSDLWRKHNIDTSTSQEVTPELKKIAEKMAKISKDIKAGKTREEAVKVFEKSL